MGDLPRDDAPPALRVPFSAAAIEAEPITTERMALRPLAIEDARDVWEYQRLADVIRYIPWPERSEDEARDHTGRRSGLRMMQKAEDAIMLACELIGEPTLREGGDPIPGGAGHRVIGDVMLRLDDPDNAGLEIGWVFHPEFQGRGLATEAASAVIDLAFDTLRAHRVHALLDDRNAASAALCTRLGMRLEATSARTSSSRASGPTRASTPCSATNGRLADRASRHAGGAGRGRGSRGRGPGGASLYFPVTS